MQGQFTAIIAAAAEGGYYAYCLEIPAVGEGETVEDCRANLQGALRLMLQDRCEEERKAATPEAWEETIQVEW